VQRIISVHLENVNHQDRNFSQKKKKAASEITPKSSHSSNDCSASAVIVFLSLRRGKIALTLTFPDFFRKRSMQGDKK